MTKTSCLGGCHYSNTNNIIEYEKVNPRTTLWPIVFMFDEFDGIYFSQTIIQKKILTIIIIIILNIHI